MRNVECVIPGAAEESRLRVILSVTSAHTGEVEESPRGCCLCPGDPVSPLRSAQDDTKERSFHGDEAHILVVQKMHN